LENHEQLHAWTYVHIPGQLQLLSHAQPPSSGLIAHRPPHAG
jgi:hypothetical protein